MTWNEVLELNNCVVPIPNALLLVSHYSHIRFGDFNNEFVPFPINIWPTNKLFKPVPPRETDNVVNVPDVTFDAFIAFFNA